MRSMSVADYIIFGAVLLLSLLVGFYYAWKSRKVSQEEQTKEYLTGKTMKLIPVSLSFVATMISSLVVLGIPAEVYTHSTQFWMSCLSATIAALVTDFVFLNMFWELQLTSINKYLLKRFNYPTLRIVSSLYFNISTVFVAGTIVYGPALAISSVTPMSIDTSIIVVGLVCAFYTAMGGIQAVIWTDVFQLAIMVAGMLMVAIQGTWSGGGWSSVWQKAEEGQILQWFNYDFDLAHGTPTFWEVFLGMSVLWAGSLSTNQMCVQRYCKLPSHRQARLSLYIGITLTSIFIIISQYCGIVLYATYYQCDPLLTSELYSPDQLMPYFVMKELTYVPGMAGLFVATVFSGSLSTLSSAINSVTVLIWDDFLKKFIHLSPTKEIIVIKLLAILFGLIITAMGFVCKRMGNVLEVVLILIGGIIGPLFGMFLIAALLPFIDGKSALVSFIFGQIVSLTYSISAMVLRRPPIRFPTSTEGCPISNQTDAVLMTFLNSTVPAEHEFIWLHKVSPVFVPVVAAVATIASGILMSFITGGMKAKDVDPQYVSTMVRDWLIKKQFDEAEKHKHRPVPLSEMKGPPEELRIS